MKKILNLLLVGLFVFVAVQAFADELEGDVGSQVCGDVQIEAQEAVIDGMPYANHGQMVKAAANVVSPYLEGEEVTEECSSCIVHQFARRVPIDEQESCGAESPDPECEAATCETFIPCENPGGCGDPICVSIVEGGGVCVEGSTGCEDSVPCETSDDCLDGFCVKDTCCGISVCTTEAIRCDGSSDGVEAAAAAGIDGSTMMSR
jgi:hypothetical protein